MSHLLDSSFVRSPKGVVFKDGVMAVLPMLILGSLAALPDMKVAEKATMQREHISSNKMCANERRGAAFSLRIQRALEINQDLANNASLACLKWTSLIRKS